MESPVEEKKVFTGEGVATVLAGIFAIAAKEKTE